jgi:hypothetical protein
MAVPTVPEGGWRLATEVRDAVGRPVVRSTLVFLVEEV